MTWRLESNGASGSNRVLIEPVSEGPHKGEAVTIKVTSRNGELPTMPFLSAGQTYTSRDGMDYQVLHAGVHEIGPDSGERSIWCYVYLAAIGVFTGHPS